jgi:hypothetical protein
MNRRDDRLPPWMPRTPLGWALTAVGLGALVAGATTLLVLFAVMAFALAPLAVWVAWNVLDFAGAIGAPELGFWGVLLLTLFLAGGFGVRIAVALVVWLVDPSWLHGAARLHWPQSSLRVFVAIVLLLAVAAVPGRRRERAQKRGRREAERAS